MLWYGDKKLLYRDYLKKPYQRKELKKMYEKINGAPREGA
jgi:arsenate reductase-like glutaredoxin family protein